MTGVRHAGGPDRGRPGGGGGSGWWPLVVLVDQLSKWWAVDRLASGPVHVVWRLDLILSYNTGLGLQPVPGGDPGDPVVVALALVAVLGVLVWRAPTLGRAAVLGLILGGALGNLADRLFRGHHGAVVDFVALHFWPTFNVADACITVGCILLAVSLAASDQAPVVSALSR